MMFLFFLFESLSSTQGLLIKYMMGLFSSGLWIQHWHVGASLASSCCAAFQVAWHLSSFPPLTYNLSLCFFNVIVLFGPLFFFFLFTCWSSSSSFSTFVFPCHLPAYLCHTLFSFVCGFVPPPPKFSLVSSLLQCCPTHLRWHHSHHAVTVPRWTKGWVWFPAVQEFHVSRFVSNYLSVS